jgi:hypothetical protein
MVFIPMCGMREWRIHERGKNVGEEIGREEDTIGYKVRRDDRGDATRRGKRGWGVGVRMCSPRRDTPPPRGIFPCIFQSPERGPAYAMAARSGCRIETYPRRKMAIWCHPNRI